MTTTDFQCDGHRNATRPQFSRTKMHARYGCREVAALAAAAGVALGANAIQQRHFNAQFVALPYGRRVTLDCLLRFPGRSDGGLRCRAQLGGRHIIGGAPRYGSA